MLYRQLPLSTIKVSVIGFGASPLGNEFQTIDPADGERAVRHAVARGINFFDVSPYYGRTLAEKRLGVALESIRHDVVISTKCGRYDTDCFDFSAKRVTQSLEESLGRLKTDYVDILYAHDIEFAHREQILNETIPALRKLKEQGKVRLIGVTGLPLKLLADVARAGEVDIVMSYCRYNLMIRDLDIHLSPVLERRGIGLVNASPLHMGILTKRGAPAWHPAPNAVKEAGKRIVELGSSRHIDLAPAGLRFCLDHPYICSTFVGMSQAEHVDANLMALQLASDREFLAAVESTAGDALNTSWPSGLQENQD